MEAAPKVAADVSIKLRALAHELSNSLEAVMQASYLLGQTTADESSQQWIQLLDQASREAARINREIREVLRSNS
jgi:signal transduction histidine kinase